MRIIRFFSAALSNKFPVLYLLRRRVRMFFSDGRMDRQTDKHRDANNRSYSVEVRSAKNEVQKDYIA